MLNFTAFGPISFFRLRHLSNALVYPGRLRPALGTPMAWHYSWHLIFLIFALSFSFLHFPSDAISSIFNGATLKGPFSIGSTKKPISRMCRSQLTRFVCLCIPNSDCRSSQRKSVRRGKVRTAVPMDMMADIALDVGEGPEQPDPDVGLLELQMQNADFFSDSDSDSNSDSD